MEIIKKPVKVEKLKTVAKQQFVDFVKAVVDVEQEIMAVGGELHADEESLLLEQGSKQQHLWGINIWVNKPEEEWIEYTSLINIRPSQGNRSIEVEDPMERQKIKAIVSKLVKNDD